VVEEVILTLRSCVGTYPGKLGNDEAISVLKSYNPHKMNLDEFDFG
jgi:hypothetical protein